MTPVKRLRIKNIKFACTKGDLIPGGGGKQFASVGQSVAGVHGAIELEYAAANTETFYPLSISVSNDNDIIGDTEMLFEDLNVLLL